MNDQGVGGHSLRWMLGGWGGNSMYSKKSGCTGQKNEEKYEKGGDVILAKEMRRSSESREDGGK